MTTGMRNENEGGRGEASMEYERSLRSTPSLVPDARLGNTSFPEPGFREAGN
jgi:hypothetical protein